MKQTSETLKTVLSRLFKAQNPKASVIGLPGGSQLFGAGDEADHFYVLKSGRLGVYRHSFGQKDSHLIGVIRSDEPVGEMSLIAGTVRSHSVVALRDSDLWALPREAFLEAIEDYPELLLHLTRTVISRQTAQQPNRQPQVFGFCALSDHPIAALVQLVATACRNLGKTVMVLDHSYHGTTADSFSDIENQYDLVFHIVECHEGHWRLLSLRQVDHIFFVGHAEAPPRYDLVNDHTPGLHRPHDLILIWNHPDQIGKTRGITQSWLDVVNPNRWFHLCLDQPLHHAHIARIITGQSVGLVLSGGGARAFAHLGAVEALLAAKVPFDFIGGTSMGAIICACLAMNWPFHEIEARIRKAFVTTSPLDDISFPFVAMSSGKKVDERLDENFGGIQIEDMPLPFFAVSSNLTSGNIMVHKRGDLSRALRASIALPGILPPVIENGQVLVDGGVMSSFPAGLMRHQHLGPVVGVDVTRAKGLDPRAIRTPKNLPQWIASGEWRKGPSIVSILMRSATITTAADLAQSRAATDLLIIPQPGSIEIRDFHAYDDAVVEGYQSALDALSHIDGPVSKMRENGQVWHPNISAFTPDEPSFYDPLPVPKTASFWPFGKKME